MGRTKKPKTKDSSSSDTGSESEESNEYEVEEILDSKKIDGKIHYKVLWKGYSKDEATWEPLANLDGAKNLIKEYKQRVDEATYKKSFTSKIDNIVDISRDTRGKIVYLVLLRNGELVNKSSSEVQALAPKKLIDFLVDRVITEDSLKREHRKEKLKQPTEKEEYEEEEEEPIEEQKEENEEEEKKEAEIGENDNDYSQEEKSEETGSNDAKKFADPELIAE